MCGLAAIFDPRGDHPHEKIVNTMTRSVSHRGPNFQAVKTIGRVCLGHARLAIIDTLARANQPMSDGQHHIVYNGEVYNFASVRNELETLGEEFSTSSDTEVFLKTLKRFGVDGLNRLKGMFAFVYYDEVKGTIIAGRDRFGIKPLVFSKADGVLLLASEAKQLIDSGLVSRELNSRAASDFLVHARLQWGNATFFRDIESVGPGEVLILDCASGQIRRERWYSLQPSASNMPKNYHQVRDEVGELFHQSVKDHLISEVPLGACLSGGIDSSAIVCTAAAGISRPLTTITTFSSSQGYDERKYSRAVVRATGCKSIEVEVDAEDIWDMERLRELSYYQDQPTKGGSQYNEYIAYKAAKDSGLTVMLDGQGSDEYFGGYGEFWYAAQVENLLAGRLGAFAEGIKAEAEGRRVSVRVIMTNFLRNAIRLIPQSRSKNFGIFGERWNNFDYPAETEGPPLTFQQLSTLEITSTSVPFQLHSQDRNSMRWSVESRVPFLDHELVEYVLSVPSHFKQRKGLRKGLLRDAVPQLPPEVALRKDKVGFAAPDEIGLRALAGPVREELSQALEDLSAILDHSVVSRAFENMIHGGKGYDGVFFRILSLNAWRQAFNVKI